MKIQILIMSVLLASVRGVNIPPEYGIFPYGPTPPVAVGPLGLPAVVTRPVEPFSRPEYSYGYDVHDPISGDSKAQYETRNGDIVQGSYTLIEADGSRRIVDYSSDPINGFNAVVNKEPAIPKPVPVVQAKPAAVAIVKPAPIAPVAVGGFHPPAATLAPLPFVIGRHGYGYSRTPFVLPYY